MWWGSALLQIPIGIPTGLFEWWLVKFSESSRFAVVLGLLTLVVRGFHYISVAMSLECQPTSWLSLPIAFGNAT
jgi:hypothetical protein